MTTEEVAKKCRLSKSYFYKMLHYGFVTPPASKDQMRYVWTKEECARAIAEARTRRSEDRRTLQGRLAQALRIVRREEGKLP